MPLVNTHSHTALCGHGEGTVAELVAAADAAGIEVLAVTEHFPLSGVFDPRGDEAMPRESVAGYLADIDRARAERPHMTILSGCEMDWLGAAEDRTPAERDTSRFDVVLGSVHFLGTWGIDNEDIETVGKEIDALIVDLQSEYGVKTLSLRRSKSKSIVF